MIGGVVMQVIEQSDKKTLVVRGIGVERREIIRVDVEKSADVEETDSVWWQMNQVLVTRGSQFEHVFRDKSYRKIGSTYGHAVLPENV